MSKLPVREMVLYKHGVGFFRREGTFDGEEVTLTFRHDEINDVLKSLAAFDRQGGQVLGIHYQTPMDKAARLADSAIKLSDAASLFDLLRDLRGRVVTLLLDTGEVAGRVIGIDLPRGKEEGLGDALVSITSEEGVRVFKLAAVQGVKISDERAQHDLGFFLDTSMTEDIRRTVTLRLSAGDHHLVAYYVAPTPTWRVSYRVVAESDENAESKSGEALLQGWGLFDNRLDEDLEDVSVTLVAGQPISFIYDLYASRIPERPVIEDEARIAPGPVEFRGGGALLKRIEKPPEERARGFGLTMAGAAYAPAMAAAPAPAQELSLDQMQSATTPAAEGREAGEFFQYVVTTPVSVKRGDSALVPILGSNVKYTKELLYNGAKLPTHPVAAIRFENSSGLTLERGPVTLVEDGEYKGEAIIDFTKTGNNVYLPYAVELGIRVTEDHDGRTEMAGLSLEGGYLVIEEHHVRSVTYLIENTTGEAKTVTIEALITQGYDVFDTRNPDVTNATERRWRVEAPPNELTDFTILDRRLLRRYEEVRRLDYRRLQEWLADQWLDRKTYDRLSEILDSIGLIQSSRAEIQQLEAERKTIYERQGQLRENLNTLKPGGEEGQLRTRMLRQLEASENRLEEIEQRIFGLQKQIEETEARLEALIAALK